MTVQTVVIKNNHLNIILIPFENQQKINVSITKREIKGTKRQNGYIFITRKSKKNPSEL